MEEKIEEVRKKKSFNGDIIKRMMSDEEFETFWEKYRLSRRVVGVRNRFQIERAPLTDNERKLLNEYFNSTDSALPEISEKYGIPNKSINNVIYRLIVRVAWINKEKLGF